MVFLTKFEIPLWSSYLLPLRMSHQREEKKSKFANRITYTCVWPVMEAIKIIGMFNQFKFQRPLKLWWKLLTQFMQPGNHIFKFKYCQHQVYSKLTSFNNSLSYVRKLSEKILDIGLLVLGLLQSPFYLIYWAKRVFKKATFPMWTGAWTFWFGKKSDFWAQDCHYKSQYLQAPQADHSGKFISDFIDEYDSKCVLWCYK